MGRWRPRSRSLCCMRRLCIKSVGWSMPALISASPKCRALPTTGCGEVTRSHSSSVLRGSKYWLEAVSCVVVSAMAWGRR